jgi:hypothetical protein
MLEATRHGSGVRLVFYLCRLRTDRCSSPFVMFNACLTFSWPNKVPFDREASDIIRARTYMGARIGDKGSVIGMRRVSPRCILAVGRSLGTVGLVYPAMFTGIVSLVICSSLDR